MLERRRENLLDVRGQFMRDEEKNFSSHINSLVDKVLPSPEKYPLKVVKYARLAQAGLPLDFTVRYYPGKNREEMLERVSWLTENGLEVWASFAPPDPPGISRLELPSSAQTTDLVKRITSPESFQEKVFYLLDNMKVKGRRRYYPSGTWIKTFYDSYEREIISGSLSFSSDDKKPLSALWSRNSQVILEIDFTPDLREIHGGIRQKTLLILTWNDGVWRYRDPRDKNKNGRFVCEALPRNILEKVTSFLGPEGSCTKGLTTIATLENRPSLDFEFKTRPEDPFLSFFLIDYEFGGERGLNLFEKRQNSGKLWFYRREGD